MTLYNPKGFRRLNRSHPLANGLKSFIVMSDFRDYALNRTPRLEGTVTGPRIQTQHGHGFLSNAADWLLSPIEGPSKDFTMGLFLQWKGGAVGCRYCAWGIGDNAVSIWQNATGKSGVASGGSLRLDAGNIATAGVYYTVIVTRRSGTMRYYQDGVQRASGADATVYSGFGFQVGKGDGTFPEASINTFILAFAANRGWNDQEIAAFQNPDYRNGLFQARRFNLRSPAVVIKVFPTADNIDGGWTNELGSNVNLFASIDEPVLDDADYIRSEDNPVEDLCRVKLDTILTSIQEPFNVHYRYKKVGSATINLTARLLQGATVKAEWSHSNITTSFVDAQQTLTAPQFASISDFTDLYLEFEANPVSFLALADGSSLFLLADGSSQLILGG
jgi:hypothetical protein